MPLALDRGGLRLRRTQEQLSSCKHLPSPHAGSRTMASILREFPYTELGLDQQQRSQKESGDVP